MRIVHRPPDDYGITICGEVAATAGANDFCSADPDAWTCPWCCVGCPRPASAT